MDRPIPAYEPTIVLHLWPSAGLEYWHSRALNWIGVPLRTWFEPIEDEE